MKLKHKGTPTAVRQDANQLSSNSPSIQPTVTKNIPYGRAEEHHHISASRNDSFYLSSWQRQHIYDPAIAVNSPLSYLINILLLILPLIARIFAEL